jgi:predicted metal-dependent hydrolase
VDVWAEKLGVTVNRVQVRPMRQKWASMSSNGNLTLADDLLEMAAELVDYVIVHELLHLKISDHGRGFRATMSAWLPDWEERERMLSIPSGYLQN